MENQEQLRKALFDRLSTEQLKLKRLLLEYTDMLPCEAPTLGISVSETIQSADKFGG
jgi:hypothetical protein